MTFSDFKNSLNYLDSDSDDGVDSDEINNIFGSDYETDSDSD